MKGLDFYIKWDYRDCEVNGEPGLFCTWEWLSNVVDASPFMGGHPGGQVSKIIGIVEFADGIRRVDPTDIKFCDELHASLCALSEYKKKKRKGAPQ